jgi:methanethiol oxidase
VKARHLAGSMCRFAVQRVLELRPAHDPPASWGFAGVAISTADLSASVWRWHRDGADRAVDKVITIPAEPAEPASLPPALLQRGRRMVSRRPGHREIWFAATVGA